MRGKRPWNGGEVSGARIGDPGGAGAVARLVFPRLLDEGLDVGSLDSVETVVETKTSPKSSAPGGWVSEMGLDK